MQRSINNLIDFTISAKDGELGKVSKFFFDDLTWLIRYLVVETGNWLSERKVLIPHAALGETDWKKKTFQVNLTMEQVRQSPDIDTEKTVSRQHEIVLFNHYALPVYWGNGFYAGPIGMVPFYTYYDRKPVKEDNDSTQQLKGDTHLRSAKEVKGYHIHADDGEIGHVEDFIIDDETWAIRYLIIDTKNWWPGKKVLVSPKWMDRISWSERKAFINLSREAIKQSPEYTEESLLTRDYESALHRHYNRKGYWVDEPVVKEHQS